MRKRQNQTDMIATQQAVPVTRLLKKEIRFIRAFTNDRIASKLMAMGVLPGSSIQIIRIAPLSGGYYLRINGQNIALRPEEAESIVVA